MDQVIRHPLAYARQMRGWSQPELAAQIAAAARRRGLRSGVDRQRVWKWETSRATPDTDSQMLLADAFGIGQGLVRVLGWPDWLPGGDETRTLAPHSTPAALREALAARMDRRNFVAYTAASLTGFAHEWATATPAAFAAARQGKPVDADLVGSLESISRNLTTAPTAQRQYTAPLLDDQLKIVTSLVDEGRYSEQVGKRLHRLAAGLAQTVGWHRFDHGRHAAAARFWHAAVHSAHTCEDHDLGAGVLSDLAYQSLWLRDPATSVAVLDRALRRPLHPAARSVLHLRKARAHAALGEEHACTRSLGAAEKNFETAAGAGAAPAWCAWMSRSDLAVDTGRCLLDLGHTRQAHALIQNGTEVLPVAREKTRAVFLAYEAEGYLRGGEIDRAAHAAHTALAMAQRIGAPRCTALISGMMPAFKKHKEVPGVAQLLEKAQTARL
ncbi:helix-turn-helix domain-containing protein [Streptomyces albireticuli]|uniref:helix-turn-helix transcriptional regulator n=1 Tax=Streptomyces albireticuli TaxID=1940 RepID=UPI001E2EBBB4|nr:helix-turn-helix transcriptional regulator [Streptomyces albireticuli]MCD9142761.1 helix-turn-helix domain-containing protein [Streptomyces albireticuli]MCD9162920.1 helix-turn-helix domain-containing protein [Streptomyces albireticuli]